MNKNWFIIKWKYKSGKSYIFIFAYAYEKRYWLAWKDGTPQLIFQPYTYVQYARGIVAATVKKAMKL